MPVMPDFWPALDAPTEASAEQYWLVYRGRDLLVHREHGVAAGPELGAEIAANETFYLGRLSGCDAFAVDTPDDAEAPKGFDFVPLFSLYGKMSDPVQKLAARAIQIIEWDRTHRHCGACGKPTERSGGERSRVCPSCEMPFYPRVAPSMIVAVERGDEILLARSPHFPPGIWSVLAGFVEPGESAEDTVRREVFEETGIHVGGIEYFGSQPWPHPHSLMLGYKAVYEDGDVTIDGVEIVEAGFFRHDEMPRCFPGTFSIAQRLIGDFLERRR